MTESLKTKLTEIIGVDQNDGQSVSFSLTHKYQNLVLDEMEINKMTAEDKEFLEEKFGNCELLCMNETKLTSLDNLPQIKSIMRVSNFICSWNSTRTNSETKNWPKLRQFNHWRL